MTTTKADIKYPRNIDDLPMMDINTPLEEAANVRKEIERLLRRKTIIETIKGLRTPAREDKAAKISDVKPTAPDPKFLQPTLFESKTINSYERDSEIADIIVANRAALAVDTMGPMSEHLFYAHFIRTVGLGEEIVTPGEFRQFLKACNQEATLFM